MPFTRRHLCVSASSDFVAFGVFNFDFTMPPFAVSIPGLQEDEGGDVALEWDKVVSEQSAALRLAG